MVPRAATVSRMVAMDELEARNRAFVASAASPVVGGSPPRMRLAIVTCMDARIDVTQAFGLRPGEAHVLRNAGGLVTDDVLRSLVLSQRLLGTIEIMVVQHTECGVQGLRDADMAGRLAAQSGEPVPFSFGGFADLEESVRASLARVCDCPWLVTTDLVRGYVYEIDSGKLRQVVTASP
jgi:carbonic anhydrase